MNALQCHWCSTALWREEASIGMTQALFKSESAFYFCGHICGSVPDARSLRVVGRQVTEERLIELLEQVNEQTAQRTKVTMQRRQRADDDW